MTFYKGHSGATIIARDGKIIKQCAPGSIVRFKKQIEKQKEARTHCFAPEVFSFDEETGVATMEKINGSTLAHLILNGSEMYPIPYDVIGKQIAKFLADTHSVEIGEVLAEHFIAKIDAISVKMAGVAGPDIKKALVLLRYAFQNGPVSFKQVRTHGDLTLENIIITPFNECCFIDFDDIGELSVREMDFGKLYQDILGMWFTRHHTLVGPYVRKRLIHLNTSLLKHVPGAEHWTATLPAFTALSLARTMPYSTDPHVLDFVAAKIIEILETPK